MLLAEHPPDSPVLVYDRIAENARATRLLIALFAILVLPVMAFLAAYGGVWLLMFSPVILHALQSQGQQFEIWIVMSLLALVGLLVLALLKYRSVDDTTLRILGARPPDATEEGFVRAVSSLCLGAGLPMPRLYVVDNRLPNAFSLGLSPERASLAVTRGLLDLLDRLELEGVIAHELSHIGNRDSRLNTVLSAMLRTMILPFPIRVILWLSLAAAAPMYLSLWTGETAASTPFGGQELILMNFQLGIVLWVLLWPQAGRLVQRLMSRRREFLADADAVLLTRYPAGLIRALIKADSAISAAGPVSRKRHQGLLNPAFHHLFLLSPLAHETAFDAHPPVAARVQALAGLDESLGKHIADAARSTGEAFARPQEAGPPPVAASEPEGPRDVLRASLGGIRLGMALLGFMLGGNLLAAIVLDVPVGMDGLIQILMLASSLGFVVAGYTAAHRYAPERRLALLGTLLALSFVWMFALGFLMSVPSLLAGGNMESRLAAWLVAAVLMVAIGGVAGALIQAWVVRPAGRTTLLRQRIFGAPEDARPSWSAAAPLSRNDQAPTVSIPTKLPDTAPGSVRNAGDALPTAEAAIPARRIACPTCGGIIEASAHMCIWCGARRSPPTTSR